MDALLQTEAFENVEVVMTSMRRQGSTTQLRVMIDRPSGVDLALCETLAKGINTALHEQSDLYTLEVESAGLDRPLVKDADYERFRGRMVCVKTTALIEGAKTHRGKLEGLREGHVVLSRDSGDISIPQHDIKQANLEFDLRAALRRGKDEAPTGRPSLEKRENRT